MSSLRGEEAQAAALSSAAFAFAARDGPWRRPGRIAGAGALVDGDDCLCCLVTAASEDGDAEEPVSAFCSLPAGDAARERTTPLNRVPRTEVGPACSASASRFLPRVDASLLRGLEGGVTSSSMLSLLRW